MEIDNLEENLMKLSVELTALKNIIDVLDKKGGQEICHWLHEVERIAGDKDEMQAQLDTLIRPYGRVELDEILIKELNAKVIESLQVVQALKEPAFQTFLLQITQVKLKRCSHDDLILFTSKFSKRIGFGGFSKVYLGRFSDGVQVAVKVLAQNRDISNDVLRDIFMIEVSTMIKASHPNLIRLYGFCFDDNMKALIYEYMENGSLDKVLFKKHIVIEWRRLYEIAIDTAKVLAYLHHECDDQIIHHDIKPANILLDSSLSPKITDFGVAKIMNRDVTHFTMTRTRGTSCYIAPELTIQASRVTHTCDVYSFGMTLFDILGMRINSQTQPSFPKEVWHKFDKGKLDEIINKCDILEKDAESARILSMVALWCIQFTPEIRPSMKDVVNVLENNLQVEAPPNPFLTSDKLFSIRQSPDMTYSTVSTSIHQSFNPPRGNSTMDTLQEWDEEFFGTVFASHDDLIMFTEDKLERYSHDDIIMFTSNFSTRIGFGGISEVYLGQLSDGVQVAVKVLRQTENLAKDVLRNIFMAQVNSKINASHPNLIKLYGFCFVDNMKALIYEYMENGSLDKVLFKKRILVEWRRLYEIAIDTAKALAYLHHDCDDQIIHCNINPGNILLDSSLSPKITNFEVAKIMNMDETHFTMTGTRGTSWYAAPEMMTQASRVRYTCDVYSFGRILFDILGMRINSRTQPSFLNEVWRKFDKGKLDEIINKCDISEKDAESARILSMVALWCIQFTPEIRPSMKDVVNVLENNLQVEAPPNPFLAFHKRFSMIQSPDMTYSTVSTFTH